MNKYKINDILYTKNGKLCGNLTIIDIQHTDTENVIYTCISDYGNIINTTLNGPSFSKQFYLKTGKTTPTHKYHDYKLNYPEYSI